MQLKDKFQENLKKSYVKLKVSTWSKDSYGLYDYQSKAQNIDIAQYSIDRQCRIYRNPFNLTTEIIDYQQNNQLSQQYVLIGNIKLKKQKQIANFELQSGENLAEYVNSNQSNKYPQLSKYTYFVAKDYSNDVNNYGYRLKPGNIVKLGRSQYKILEIRNQYETVKLAQAPFNNNQKIIEITQLQKEQNPTQCRICLCPQQKQQDPLISPCLCMGSMKHIHLECLQRQICGKVIKQSETIISYNFDKLACTICNFSLSKVMNIHGKNYQMLELTKPQTPYILLLNLKNQQSLCLVKIKNGNRIKIGRSHQCQIRIDDISVSRVHAQIKFINNNFYINDLKSKFGTLIKFDDKCQLNVQIPTKIQYGRSVFELKIIHENNISQAQSDTD